MAVNNKQILTDILKVVKKIYKLLKKNKKSKKKSKHKHPSISPPTSPNDSPPSSHDDNDDDDSPPKKKRGRKPKSVDPKQLKNIVRQLSSQSAYASLGVRKMAKKIHDKHPHLRLKDIEKEIRKKPIVQQLQIVNAPQMRKQFRHITAPSPFYSIQMDVMDMIEYHGTGKSSFTYILLIIDVFSRYMIAKKLKTREHGEMAREFQDAIEYIRQTLKHKERPVNVVSDQEFNSEEFNDVADNLDLHQQFSNDNTKGYKTQIVERGVRTLKQMIERIVQEKKDFKWEKYLDTIVKTYNTTSHRSIGTDPNYAQHSGNIYIPKHLQNAPQNVKIIPNGTQVRLKMKKKPFDKGHRVKWSQEVYTIANFDRDRHKYSLEEIDEVFSRHMLLIVDNISTDSEGSHTDVMDTERSESVEPFDNALPQIPEKTPEMVEPQSPKSHPIPDYTSTRLNDRMKIQKLQNFDDENDSDLDFDISDDDDQTPKKVDNVTTPSTPSTPPTPPPQPPAPALPQFAETIQQQFGRIRRDDWFIVPVEGDGNCLFNSIVGATHFSDNGIIPTRLPEEEQDDWKRLAQELRENVCKWILEHQDDPLQAFGEHSLGSMIYQDKYDQDTRKRYDREGKYLRKKAHTVKKYVKTMSKNGVWGGMNEVLACGYFLDRNIFVYYERVDEPNVYYSNQSVTPNDDYSNIIRLFHNVSHSTQGSHYQYLEDISKINETALNVDKRKKRKKSRKFEVADTSRFHKQSKLHLHTKKGKPIRRSTRIKKKQQQKKLQLKTKR